MIRRMCIAVTGLLWFAGAAAAQPPALPAQSFEELRISTDVGETVEVIDMSGRQTTGRITSISDLGLTLTVDAAARTLAEADVRRIDRRRKDSVRNGLLLGTGAGALLGFGLGRSLDSPSCSRPGIECGQGTAVGTVSGALWGAVAGWITDALVRKREIVYLAPGARPPQTNRRRVPSKP
jgi:hypothetical protein